MAVRGSSPDKAQRNFPRYSLFLSLTHRGIDSALIVLCLYLANRTYQEQWSLQLTVLALLSVSYFQAFAPISGLYRRWSHDSLRSEFSTVLGNWCANIPIFLLTAFITKTTDNYSRVVISVWLLATPLALSVYRIVLRRSLQSVHLKRPHVKRVVIAGATESGISICSRLSLQADSHVDVAGFYDDRTKERLAKIDLRDKEHLGSIDKLLVDARSGAIDTVYIALPLRAEHRIKTLISRLADTTATVYVVTDLFMFNLMHAHWGTVGDIPVVSVFDTPFHGLGGWVKRAEDVLLSGVILCLIAAPMALIALAVKLTSTGPIFFCQTRYGLNGQPIRVLKFRSMSTCDNGPTIVQAKENDVRITPLGSFLRRTSLDELPQFLNVLRGEMSVVGPRPHAVAHNELYRSQIHGYMLRHKVKPGITGWAQVNGWRGETERIEKMEHRVEHDLYYIDNWSFFWDIQIVFLTIFGKKTHKHAH